MRLVPVSMLIESYIYMGFSSPFSHPLLFFFFTDGIYDYWHALSNSLLSYLSLLLRYMVCNINSINISGRRLLLHCHFLELSLWLTSERLNEHAHPHVLDMFLSISFARSHHFTSQYVNSANSSLCYLCVCNKIHVFKRKT